MRRLFRTPFAAVFRNELRLNSKRVAPYAMAALFAGNALLWWGWGPAGSRGWATNSDFFIVRSLAAFSFMTVPLFTAVLMGDPVIRDFRAGVEPLIFSTPVGRGQYLLGKFFGSFFVLVCCQAAFPVAFLVLQAFHKAGMVVLPARVSPYVEYFLVIVVVSHLALAAVYFTVGTLTRNAKIVYGLGVSFYPLYITYQVAVIKGLPSRWRIALDPLLMNWSDHSAKLPGGVWAAAAEELNRLTLSYDANVLSNRALMVLVAALCLAILYARFSTVERRARQSAGDQLTTLGLGEVDERLHGGREDFSPDPAPDFEEVAPRRMVAIPAVTVSAGGARAGLGQMLAATRVEFHLLLAERSLVVLLPLATLVSVMGLAYYEAAPEPTYSAAYAARTWESFLLFLFAVAVFYTGESMHRDRELRVEPVLWSAPAPNYALLLSKFATTLLLSAAAGALVFASAAALQVYKRHAPLEVLTYVKVYALILLPGAAFMTAGAAMLNVLLRDKYVAYAACLAAAGALIYLFNLGHTHPLYNPILYGLWTPADLAPASPRLAPILTHRLYCLSLAALCLSLAHLLFARKSARGLRAGARLGGKGWAALSASVSAVAALVTGLMVRADW